MREHETIVFKAKQSVGAAKDIAAGGQQKLLES
jgi:hypothetical protein